MADQWSLQIFIYLFFWIITFFWYVAVDTIVVANYSSFGFPPLIRLLKIMGGKFSTHFMEVAIPQTPLTAFPEQSLKLFFFFFVSATSFKSCHKKRPVLTPRPLSFYVFLHFFLPTLIFSDLFLWYWLHSCFYGLPTMFLRQNNI